MLISIVMPTLNEAATLPERAREIHQQGGPFEWIVSDGGSTDATVALAQAAGAIVVSDARGRGPQLDAGAARARGETLLFVHADTALPPNALAAIRSALRDERYVGGNFTLRFDDDGLAGAMLATGYRLQQRFLGLYFGDSAIFARRTSYVRAGGFGALTIMEDYEFARKLSRIGPTVHLRDIVVTSARRYRGRPLRTLGLWLTIFALYRCGVPAQRLYALYAPHRSERR